MAFGVEVEISLGQVFHDNVDVVLVLEGFMDVCEERMLPERLDQFCLEEVLLVYFCFWDHFHCEFSAC